MDVSCPACAARYTANDEKLRGKTARMRCKTCNNVWLVSGPSAEPRRAAVVKTGAERENRDLFAKQNANDGVVKQTLVPPPSTGFTGVGARNENSVLFSLDQLSKTALTKNAPQTARMPETAAARVPSARASDDDGVIDLRALSSAPPQRPIGLPVAPLFSEPAGMAFDVNATGKHSLTKTFSTGQLVGGIAAAAALILVAAFGIALTFRGEAPVKHAAMPAALLPPPAVVAPPPAAEPPPAPKTDAADNSEADARATAETGTKGKGKKARAAKSKGATTTTAAAAAPKPVKAADPCHCKGNFDCILACTVKRGK